VTFLLPNVITEMYILGSCSDVMFLKYSNIVYKFSFNVHCEDEFCPPKMIVFTKSLQMVFLRLNKSGFL